MVKGAAPVGKLSGDTCLFQGWLEDGLLTLCDSVASSVTWRLESTSEDCWKVQGDDAYAFSTVLDKMHILGKC